VDLITRRAERAVKKGETYQLAPEEVGELQQEGIQYYHRYISLFQLNDYVGVIRATARNLEMFDFVSKHASNEDLAWSVEQFTPYVRMMNTRAKAAIALEREKHADAVALIEKGMEEHDFAELAKAGVTLLGEVGLGSVKAGDEAKKMVAWARKYGIQSTIHTGGPSVPGSGYIDKDVVLEADADVIGHINGGHTALDLKQIECLCEQCGRAIEIVHNGNELAGLHAVKVAKQLGQLERVILGTDSPAGSGVQPLGILRVIAMLSSFGDLPAEQVFCFATGNTARIRNLDCGLLEPGRSADFVFMDKAQHSSGRDLLDSVRKGDLPGIGMVVIDGVVRCQRSRNTPPADRVPAIAH
jgi:enamidase